MPTLQGDFAHGRSYEEPQTSGERDREPNRRKTIKQRSKIGKNLILDFAKARKFKARKSPNKIAVLSTPKFVALDRPRSSDCLGAGPLRTAEPSLQLVVGSRASALLSVVPCLRLVEYVAPVGTPGRLRGIPDQRSPERWRARAPQRSMSARSGSGERTSAAPK